MKLNRRGMTLVQALMGTVILVTSISAVATLFSIVSKQSQFIEKLKDVNLLHIKIRALLQQRTACENTLRARYGAAIVPVNNHQLNDILTEAAVPTTAYSRLSEVLPEVSIQDMRIRNFGPTAPAALVPGDRYMSLEITYRIDQSVFAAFNYDMIKIIPIYMQFDDPTTVPVENTFQYCLTKGLEGVDREYMNAFQHDMVATNSQYAGGTYPPLPAPQMPVGAIATDMAALPPSPPALLIQSQLHVLPSAADPLNSGYMYARQFETTSDRTQKENIKRLTDPLLSLNQFHAYEYNFKGDPKKELGLMAQDIEMGTPLVRQMSNGVKAVNYNGVLGLQIEAVKAVHQEQKQLNQKLEQLKKELLEIQSDLK